MCIFERFIFKYFMDDLELLILLLSPNCWDYRQVPIYSQQQSFIKGLQAILLQNTLFYIISIQKIVCVLCVLC